MIVVKKMAVVMIIVEKSMVAYFLDSCNVGTRIVDFDDTPIVIDKHVRAVTFAFHKGETVATSLSVENLGDVVMVKIITNGDDGGGDEMRMMVVAVVMRW
ncbi:hypothetical protein Tco_1113241 [Tanacetum coccineum]|uniref:Uncharacterized protein n=1 Tax=Tanacetum coccineum TaxID=301880 RepID=A0ABQ5IRL4_9ASTR